jgi:hypothetical protein
VSPRAYSAVLFGQLLCHAVPRGPVSRPGRRVVGAAGWWRPRHSRSISSAQATTFLDSDYESFLDMLSVGLRSVTGAGRRVGEGVARGALDHSRSAEAKKERPERVPRGEVQECRQAGIYVNGHGAADAVSTRRCEEMLWRPPPAPAGGGCPQAVRRLEATR